MWSASSAAFFYQMVKAAHPTKAIANAMNHDVTAGGYAGRSGALAIRSVWVRHVKRTVIPTVSVATIDCVNTFRCSIVSLAHLRPVRTAAERDGESFKHRTVRNTG